MLHDIDPWPEVIGLSAFCACALLAWLGWLAAKLRAIRIREQVRLQERSSFQRYWEDLSKTTRKPPEQKG